jgi:hypothetical protein
LRRPAGFRAFRLGQESLLPQPTHKRCRVCGELKPLDRLVKSTKKSPDGYQAFCKDCKQEKARADYAANPEKYRERQYMMKFGLTLEDLEEMREAQGGGCAICGKEDSRSRLDPDNPAKHLSIAKLHVDHNATTGEVRGLLCGPCNRGIGMFYDDPELLTKAIQYLRRFS